MLIDYYAYHPEWEIHITLSAAYRTAYKLFRVAGGLNLVKYT